MRFKVYGSELRVQGLAIGVCVLGLGVYGVLFGYVEGSGLSGFKFMAEASRAYCSNGGFAQD